MIFHQMSLIICHSVLPQNMCTPFKETRLTMCKHSIYFIPTQYINVLVVNIKHTIIYNNTASILKLKKNNNLYDFFYLRFKYRPPRLQH